MQTLSQTTIDEIAEHHGLDFTVYTPFAHAILAAASGSMSAADLQAAIKKTLTSAAFGKFMEQAVHTAVAELQAQPDTITLKRAPMGRVEFSEMDDFRVYSAHSADYTREINMQTERLATGVKQTYKPGVWYGSERITCPDGSTWSRSLGNHVQDDFGMLVPLAALQGGAA